jgi:hypothetical protein
MFRNNHLDSNCDSIWLKDVRNFCDSTHAAASDWQGLETIGPLRPTIMRRTLNAWSGLPFGAGFSPFD